MSKKGGAKKVEQKITKSSGGGSIMQDMEDPSNFESSDNTLYSSKKEIVSCEVPEIPKFLRDKKKFILSQYALAQKEGRYSWAKLKDVEDLKNLSVLKNHEGLSEDVVQGELGDGYFLSVLAALAEENENISKIVDPKAKVTDSNFKVNAIIHGQPVSIGVNDDFPVANDSKLAFAGINQETGNIWPIIVEKAWAKCNGSYEDIVRGNAADAFQFLSPGPYDTYFHNYETRPFLFEKILAAVQNGDIVLCDITDVGNTNLDELSKLGLITNHSYEILDAIVLEKKNGTKVQLLKIRNQWGTNEWAGDWSDNSQQWSKEFKEKVGLVQKEDGVFWITFDEYVQFYTTTHILKHNPTYNYTCAKFKSDPKLIGLARIEVNENGEGYFLVNQKNSKIYRNLKDPEYHNPFCNMWVFKDDGSSVTFVGSQCGDQDRLYVECKEITKGNYYVAVTFPNPETHVSGEFQNVDRKINYRVGIYSSTKAKVVETDEKEKEDSIEMIFDFIKNLADENKEKYYFAPEGEPKSWRAIHFDNDSKGLGYIFYMNNSDAFIKERATFKTLKNVTLIPILHEGKFSEQDDVAEEEPPREQVKLKTTQGKKQKTEVTDEEANELVKYESKNVENTINALKGTILPSNMEELEGKNSPNPVIEFSIAPHSSAAVLLQKTDEEADIDLDSDICIDYLPNVLLEEKKFKQKKYKLRYNDKPVEIYEFVTEHNTGVFFIYKNHSADLRLQVTANFTKLNNLYLGITSSDLEENKMKLREPNGDAFREEGDNKVSITIEPFETGFFGLKAFDSFEKFSYTCQFDYLFTISKIPAKLEEMINEGGEEEEEKE